MKQTRKEEREQHICAWRASGLSKTEYCRQKGLNRGTFYRWFREEREEPLYGFIELSTQQFQQQERDSSVESAGIGVVLPNGYRMELEKRFDEETFTTVLVLLEAR